MLVRTPETPPIVWTLRLMPWALGLSTRDATQGGDTSTFGGDEQDNEDEDEVEDEEDENDDSSYHPNFVRCYGPKLCGYLARSCQAHDAPRNADSIAYFILMLRFRKRGWRFDERTWRAKAIDDYYASKGFCGESDADNTASEEEEAYDSEDNEGAMCSEDEYENIY